MGSDERLDTGEPIRVVVEPSGKFHASADIPIRGKPITHHAFGATEREAVDRLHTHVAGLRGTESGVSVASGRPRGFPMTVCEIKGEGRIMQCVRPGAWPEHIPEPPAKEARCTACDDYKERIGVLDRVEAQWAEWERRRDGGG